MMGAQAIVWTILCFVPSTVLLLLFAYLVTHGGHWGWCVTALVCGLLSVPEVRTKEKAE